MKTVHIYYNDISPKVDELSLILGYFDGVHLGHQYLIKEARKYAKYPLAILTFDTPIPTLIDNGKSAEVLTSLDDRFKVISKLGVDYYYLFHIDKNFLNLSDEKFVEILKKLNVKEVFVGTDFRFGKDRKGDINLLKDYFDVTVKDLKTFNDQKISSQNIKDLIKDGDIKTANKLLGRNYQINGTIVSGKGIGHSIGFPTINIKPSDNYCLPRFGVYKTIAYLDNIPRLSITNVGVNPTVKEGNPITIEVHLQNYNNEQFDVASVEFIEFVRPEIKFDNLDELKKQIASDVNKVFKK